MNDAPPPAFFVPLFLLLFAGMWCVISLIISFGGWNRLAVQFRAPADPAGPQGRRFGMQSGKIGWATYSNCLTIHASPEGLRIAVWPIFRIGHPPLFIPWQAIQNPVTRRFLWIETITFEVASLPGYPPIARLQLPSKVFVDK